jgi:lambda family phage portal protein
MEKNKYEIDLNWFDRTIGFFSPTALVHRKKAKLWNSFVEKNYVAKKKRKYEGADSGRRTKGWNTGGLSADAEIAASGFLLRNRARDLVRNNPYAAGGIQVIENNVVGKGITTQIKVDTRATISNREKRLNNIWKAWAETTACDFDGRHTIRGLQKIVMRSVAESGEVLVRLRRTREREAISPDGKSIKIPPIQLQVLESDFLLSTNFVSNNQVAEGNKVIQGIEIDPQGKRVAYHIYESHPGNQSLNLGSSINTIRIPAEEILHCYELRRPGQMRGVTFLHPVMLRLRDFDLFEDAQLKRQQCAAMFTAFVHDIEGMDDDEEEAEEAKLGEKMEPGLIEILPPNKSVEFAKPPGAENYKEYTSVNLRAIAKGLGITYESLTGDLSDVNFSAGRMGWLEMHRNVASWQSLIVIGQMLDPTFKWFKESLILIGESAQSSRAVHTPQRREMIDPVKEIGAVKTAVRSGVKSLSGAVRELGEDPDNLFQEIAQDNERLDELGLVFDTDPRKRNNTGSVNTDNSEASSEAEEN